MVLCLASVSYYYYFLFDQALSDITCKPKLHFREQYILSFMNKMCRHQYSVLDNFYIYKMFLPSLLSPVQVWYGKSVSYLRIYYSL